MNVSYQNRGIVYNSSSLFWRLKSKFREEASSTGPTVARWRHDVGPLDLTALYRSLK